MIGAETAAGTSLTALTLARLMSRKANVVLVDLSLESSALSSAAVDPSAPGVSDLVSGAATFGQIITRDRMSRAQIVGAGQMKPESAMLKSPRLALAIDALTQVYDHVILDAGAIDDLPEELAASNAQALLVTRSMFDNATRAAVESELIKAGFRSVAVLDTANDNVRPDADGTGQGGRLEIDSKCAGVRPGATIRRSHSASAHQSGASASRSACRMPPATATATARGRGR